MSDDAINYGEYRAHVVPLRERIAALEAELQQARAEIAELKTALEKSFNANEVSTLVNYLRDAPEGGEQ